MQVTLFLAHPSYVRIWMLVYRLKCSGLRTFF